jgi:hypothetical protein
LSEESFRERYEKLTDDELLRVVDVRKTLVPEAAAALDREVERRKLNQPEAPRGARNPKIPNTGNDLIIMVLKCCGIFALFAACGAVSATVFCQRFPDIISYLFPLPFAFLVAILLTFVFSCALDRVVFATLLAIVVWYVSYIAAYFAGFSLSSVSGSDSVTPCALGGFIGGIGLVFCANVQFPRLVSVKYFAIGAIVGVCSAIAFIPSVGFYESHLNRGGFLPAPISAFAFWEATMGTYFFALSALAPVGGTDEYPEEGEVSSFRITPR